MRQANGPDGEEGASAAAQMAPKNSEKNQKRPAACMGSLYRRHRAIVHFFFALIGCRRACALERSPQKAKQKTDNHGDRRRAARRSPGMKIKFFYTKK